MAEFLWTFAVQEVLKKIVKLAAEEVGLAWGLEKELSKLRNWLLKAETILADINRRKLHHDSVRLWVKDLQNIVYVADDLLDELVYEDLRRTVEKEKMRKVRDFISRSYNPLLFRYKMANKMKDITETLYKHYCEASPLGLVGEESAMETEFTLKQIRETTSDLDFEVVGREIEVSDIVKLVIDSSNGHDMSVIPIVGMGGLGKTTLAKIVLNHEVIKAHFDETMWVCVSKPFVILNILEGIFQSLLNTSSGLNSKETLLKRLQKEMQDKKYFLVLDDVWDEENNLWNELSGCLKRVGGRSGNSIIVTTRSVEMATTIKTTSIHYLRKLPDDQCWSLFKKNANASQLSMNSKLEIMQERLVKKIGGVPLVAKVLGGAVKFDGDYARDYESWMTKVERIARNISKDDKDFVSSILKLSVDCLPLLALKQCFAYCSNFPQDYRFKKDELIQMWIAQGFIQPREDLIMEDIGEEYFNSLLSRSLFQDVIKDENGRITAFKMHDLIHDIACAISNCQKMDLDPNNWSGRQEKLRTLTCNDENFDSKLVDYSCLRVLVLDDIWTNDLPISMDKLIHLRYLDISNISEHYRKKPILESISMLYNLQTLKLGNVTSLLKNLRKLVNLRHLEFDGCYGIQKMPSHIGKLIHLQTLSLFVVGFEKGCKIEELGPLKNLKGKLVLRNLEKVKSKDEAIAAKLMEKKNLCQLIFRWDFPFEGEYDKCNNLEVLEGLQPHKNLQSLGIVNFGGEVLPNGVFVENLVEIKLWFCQNCKVLPMLGQLPNLKKLSIFGMNGVRSIGNEFYGIDSNQTHSFPQLKKLCINWMHNLEQWGEATLVPNLFGSLQTLEIEGCEKLTKLASGIECCNSINYFIIFDCPNLMLNVQNLQNLYHLDINGLERLPEGLAHLTNLKEMKIRGCMQNYDFSAFMHLCSLIELELYNYESNNATQLPEQLEHLTALKVLNITNFDGIDVLPEWLENLTSLETLKFCNCKNLRQLPSRKAILCLTKLNYLEFGGCPQLLHGEKAKLSHLPTGSVRFFTEVLSQFEA